MTDSRRCIDQWQSKGVPDERTREMPVPACCSALSLIANQDVLARWSRVVPGASCIYLHQQPCHNPCVPLSPSDVYLTEHDRRINNVVITSVIFMRNLIQLAQSIWSTILTFCFLTQYIAIKWQMRPFKPKRITYCVASSCKSGFLLIQTVVFSPLASDPDSTAFTGLSSDNYGFVTDCCNGDNAQTLTRHGNVIKTSFSHLLCWCDATENRYQQKKGYA